MELNEAVVKWIGEREPNTNAGLSDLLYTMDQLGLWEDEVDSVSEEQCIQCWRIIEKLRRFPYPEDLTL